MRKIKFRFYSKKSNQMREWDHAKRFQMAALDDNQDGESYSPWMQFIGLKDKNGKEIYEGDILKDKNGLGEVKWVQEHCAFLVFTRDPSEYHYLESDEQLNNSEVWGNVFDNPDWDF